MWKILREIGTAMVGGFLLLVVCGTACSWILTYRGYDGEHKDLYTVAVNNVFAAHGYMTNGEATYDPIIRVVQTDSYGRVLFFYSEQYKGGAVSEPDYSMAFGILQKHEDGYVYYYPDVCYVPYFDTTDSWDAVSERVDWDSLERLKEQNDWGRELDTEKCMKVQISDKKPKGELQPRRRQFNEIIYAYEVARGYTGEDDSSYRYSLWCETDAYGRELHYVYAVTQNALKNGNYAYRHYEYAIVFNADGTCPENGIVRLGGPEDSQALISELKQNTHWNRLG